MQETVDAAKPHNLAVQVNIGQGGIYDIASGARAPLIIWQENAETAAS